MYDVLSRHAVPPPGGCMLWEDAPAKHNAFWANGAPPPGAGAFCGASVGEVYGPGVWCQWVKLRHMQGLQGV